jgi:hypothetical protein
VAGDPLESRRRVAEHARRVPLALAVKDPHTVTGDGQLRVAREHDRVRCPKLVWPPHCPQWSSDENAGPLYAVVWLAAVRSCHDVPGSLGAGPIMGEGRW